jgi:MerR family transcriptional regulator/heat shock protein HspR
MTPRYLRVTDVCIRLAVDEQLLRRVCDEGLIEVKHTVDDEAVMSVEDAERLRVIAVLMQDLDVNLPGVEVILHLREDLCSRQRQFDEVLRTLVDELRRRIAG